MYEDTLIPALAIVFLFGAPVAAWLVSRVLAHNERMEMIRHGMVPPPSFDDKSMRRAMRMGASSQQYDPSYAANRQLHRGISVAFIGLALLIGLSFIGNFAGGEGHYVLGPWLLGGLIPLFVGVAQIFTALLSGAHLGFRPSNDYEVRFGPPPSSSDATSRQMPQEPYAWRPGSTPEIEPPARPPDPR